MAFWKIWLAVNVDGEQLGYNIVIVPQEGTLPNEVVGGFGGGGFKAIALKKAIEKQNIISTQTLRLSSKNGGGVTNTQFINKFVNVSVAEMDFVLWLETAKDDKTGFFLILYPIRGLQGFLIKKKQASIIWHNDSANLRQNVDR